MLHYNLPITTNIDNIKLRLLSLGEVKPEVVTVVVAKASSNTPLVTIDMLEQLKAKFGV